MTDKPPQNPFSEFPPGRILGDRYEVVEPIGQGGMGLVVKARDRDAGNESVAVKILNPDLFSEPTLRARFEREAAVGEKLFHPNIVQMYSSGPVGDQTLFISMEFVEGETLATKLKKVAPNGLSFDDVVQYLLQIISGLSYAHANGIIHRDINPANIMITASGEAKIADFGIARLLESAQRLTRTFESIGTAYYMSPEQLLGGKVDTRSDIYSLGVTAHEMATGSVKKSEITNATQIPTWFKEFIGKAVEGDPDDRFQSVEKMGKFLSKHTGKHVPNVSVDTTQDPHRSKFNLKSANAVAALLVVALIAAGGYYFFHFVP